MADYKFFLEDNKKENMIITPFSNSNNNDLPKQEYQQTENEMNKETINKSNEPINNPNNQYLEPMNQENPNGTFFPNQATQSQTTSQLLQDPQSNSNSNNQNSQSHPQQGFESPQNNKNNMHNHQSEIQGQQNFNACQDTAPEISQPSQVQSHSDRPETTVTVIDPDNLPPFKSAVWDMFQLQLKDKESFFKQKDYPRKPLMVDADLYSTLREIDIDNIAPTNLLNAILRTFIKSFKEELRQYRKIQAPSVF